MYIYKYSTFTCKDTYKHGHAHTHTYVHTQTYTDIHAHMYETYRIYYLLQKTMLYQNDLDNRHLMWIIWFVSKHVFQFLILLTYGMVVPILWLPKWWFCHFVSFVIHAHFYDYNNYICLENWPFRCLVLKTGHNFDK